MRDKILFSLIISLKLQPVKFDLYLIGYIVKI